MQASSIGKAPTSTSRRSASRPAGSTSTSNSSRRPGWSASPSCAAAASCPEPGIAGIAEVSSAAYPDASQFDRKSPYFDAKAKRESPRWFNADVRFVRKTRLVSLAELRSHRELSKMRTLARGNRLSITPVSADEWEFITRRLMKL